MKMRATLLSAALMSTACLTACQPATDSEAERAGPTQASEQAAAESAKAFDDAVAAGNWSLARAYGDVLLADYPNSDAAARIADQHAQIVAKAEAADNEQRLRNLWTYQSIAAGDGQQRSASIYSRDPVDIDGSGAQPVQLIFRDHPEWGRSSYLVLPVGDFDCYGGCKVQVTVDDAAPEAMAASRPDTDEAIAMFIEDEAALWALTQEAGVIAIDFPVMAGGTRTAVFEVGQLQASRMPGWD